MKVRVRPLAQRDLDEIWEYTANRWGRDQANKYFAEIRNMIHALARASALSSDADHLYPGLRKARAGVHLIYFFAGEEIDVIRVLHERRDATALL